MGPKPTLHSTNRHFHYIHKVPRDLMHQENKKFPQKNTKKPLFRIFYCRGDTNTSGVNPFMRVTHTVRYRRGLPQDLQYPCSLLESMRRCWSGAPELRPSAGALTAVCAAPECLALRDAAAARPAAAAAAAPLRLQGTTTIRRTTPTYALFAIQYYSLRDNQFPIQYTLIVISGFTLPLEL